MGEQKGESKMKLKPAAQLFTLRDYMKTPKDIAASLHKVKVMGYDAVQLSGLGAIDSRELAAILEGEGLFACVTHTGYARLNDELPAVIAEHHLWKCPNVAIGSMPGEYHGDASGYKRFAAWASDIAAKLAEAKLTFSYHNHSFEFVRFGRQTGLEIFYEQSSPLVLAEIDTYWVQHGGGEPTAWIKRLAGRQVVIHFKDMAMSEGKQVMAPVGEGNLNWPGIIDACNAGGVAWAAVEQDNCYGENPFDCLATSLRNMKEMGM
jgi:sugar phosphate isomerase/epimerase